MLLCSSQLQVAPAPFTSLPCARPLPPRSTAAMDFRGQKMAEDVYQAVIAAFSVAAFILGYAQGCARRAAACPSLTSVATAVLLWRERRSFAVMMKVFGAGVALSLLLVVPPWPYLNRHPLKWLQKSGGGGGEAAGAAGEAARQGKAVRGKAGKRCALATALARNCGAAGARSRVPPGSPRRKG